MFDFLNIILDPSFSYILAADGRIEITFIKIKMKYLFYHFILFFKLAYADEKKKEEEI